MKLLLFDKAKWEFSEFKVLNLNVTIGFNFFICEFENRKIDKEYIICEYEQKVTSLTLIKQKDKKPIYFDDDRLLLIDIKTYLNFKKIKSNKPSLLEVYKLIRSDFQSKMKVDIVKEDKMECLDIIENENVPISIKNHLVFIIGQYSSILFLSTRNISKGSIIGSYCKSFYGIVSTRAIYEKLIKLLSLLDPNIDEKKVENGKSIKGKFLKESVESDFPLTKIFVSILKNIYFLDDEFRTPEVHKFSRLFSMLTTDENYAHIGNSFLYALNDIKLVLPNLIEYIRDKYAM